MKFSIITPEHSPENIPFLLELYDYIDANYKIEQANVLKLVFQNYRKGEILKSCSITSEEYDSLIDHFNSNFD